MTESSSATSYAELAQELAALCDGEPDLVANLANATASIRAFLPHASWVGFYVMRGGQLVLGPFQGKVACVRIALRKGVCGTSAADRRTLVVPDVEAFPGHIACDAGSRSEIVVPIFRGGRPDGDVVAVLDLDSYDLAAFDQCDAEGLAPIARLLGTLAW